jgi:hypothetical protein
MFPGSGKQIHRLKFADCAQDTDSKAILVETVPAGRALYSGVLTLNGSIQAPSPVSVPCAGILFTPINTNNPFYWGGATQAQTAHATFGVYDATTKRTITIAVPKRGDGTTSVSVSANDSGGTLTAALAALAVLLNASTDPAFSAITWSSTATQIVATNKVNGLPMVFAATVAGGTGTLVADYTVDTSSAGPNVPILTTDTKGDFCPVRNASIPCVKGTNGDVIAYTIMGL